MLSHCASYHTHRGHHRTERSWLLRVSLSNTDRRRFPLRVEMRKEIVELLSQAGKGKTAKKLAEKFEQTSTLSKRDLKILRKLVAERNRKAA